MEVVTTYIVLAWRDFRTPRELEMRLNKYGAEGWMLTATFGEYLVLSKTVVKGDGERVMG